jgi:hypothetical protein
MPEFREAHATLVRLQCARRRGVGLCIPIWEETHILGRSFKNAATTGKGRNKIARPKTVYERRQPRVAINRCATEGITIAPNSIPSSMTLGANPLCRSNQCETTSV